MDVALFILFIGCAIGVFSWLATKGRNGKKTTVEKLKETSEIIDVLGDAAETMPRTVVKKLVDTTDAQIDAFFEKIHAQKNARFESHVDDWLAHKRRESIKLQSTVDEQRRLKKVSIKQKSFKRHKASQALRSDRLVKSKDLRNANPAKTLDEIRKGFLRSRESEYIGCYPRGLDSLQYRTYMARQGGFRR